LAGVRAWLSAGLVGAGVASLHALGMPMVLAAFAGVAVSTRPRRAEVARFWAPTLLLSLPWLPAFAHAATGYLERPWYTPTDAADLWLLSDAGGRRSRGWRSCSSEVGRGCARRRQRCSWARSSW
jgi:hypothetical protein